MNTELCPFIIHVAVDCGPLDNPTNGNVAVTQTEFAGVATYSCITGYVLSGGNTRTCLALGMWSGTAPTCRGKRRFHDF